jgi:hypothetical protein
MADESGETTTEMAQPIIVDLGKQKSSNLKDLKKGQGKLWDEVLSVVDEAQEMLGEEADGKVLIPIILIYEKKPKRSNLDKLIFPLMK